MEVGWDFDVIKSDAKAFVVFFWRFLIRISRRFNGLSGWLGWKRCRGCRGTGWLQLKIELNSDCAWCGRMMGHKCLQNSYEFIDLTGRVQSVWRLHSCVSDDSVACFLIIFLLISREKSV